MSRLLKWAVIMGGVLLMVLLAGVIVIGLFRFSGMPVMLPGLGYRAPFMFGSGRFGFLNMGVMLARLLIPIALMALLFLGGLAVGRSMKRSSGGQPDQTMPPSTASIPCKNCGKPVQAEWNNCPYCGTLLRNDATQEFQGENI
jgi:hypothetical protein